MADLRWSDFHQTMHLARLLLDKHGLRDWTADVQNLHNSNMYGERAAKDKFLGLCLDKEKTILLHREQPHGAARQTILHEIAHALTPSDHGHGPEWQNTALEIGCTFSHVSCYWDCSPRADEPCGTHPASGSGYAISIR